MARPRISLVIPTWQAAACLPPLLAALRRQTLPPDEIVVVDSSSDDGSAQFARSVGCRVEIIPREDFNHGGTRNRAALQTNGDILVFMTQDAMPSHPEFLANLVQPIAAGTASATFARQLPRPDATPTERFQRLFHYPAPQPHGIPAPGKNGIQFAYFSSNSAAAVSRKIFEEVGGFPPHVPCSEDMILSAKLRHAGRRLVYVAEAKVIHSHDLSLAAQFRRYFDTGAVHSQARSLLQGASPSADGRRYAAELLRHLWKDRQWRAIGFACAELGAKWTGFQLGRHQHRVPLALKLRFSQMPNYWRQRQSASSWQPDDPMVLAGTAHARSAAAGQRQS